jgi:hypothetical protein
MGISPKENDTMASKARTIKVSLSGGSYTYVDEGGKQAQNKLIKKGDTDTISWKSDSGDLAISFSDTSLFCPAPSMPITARKGKPTRPAACCANPPSLNYKYTVTITDPKTGNLKAPPDDPRIIFDDGQTPPDVQLDDTASIIQAAEKAWESLYDKLAQSKRINKDSTIEFYPHGINDIEVTVGVANVTVTVKVSGPSS